MRIIINLLTFTLLFFSSAIYAKDIEIPLVIKGRNILPKSFYPIPLRCGVPFPIGTFNEKKQQLKLINSKNKEVPLQSSITSHWDIKNKKGVRWALIDFLAEKNETYKLIIIKKKHKPKNKTKHIIIEKNGNFLINTGALKFKCSKKNLNLFSNIEAKKRNKKMSKVVNQNEWAGPYVEHQQEGLFKASLDKNIKIEIEENGPIHSVLKAEGWYKNKHRDRFCKFLLRFHFYKHKQNIKLEHTFIYTGDSHEDKIVDLGIKIPLLGKLNQIGSNFGTWVHRDISDTVNVPHTYHHVYQVMDSPDHRRMEWTIKNGENGNILFNGEKATGWMQTATSDTAMTVVIKDAWQQYPFELERIGSTNYIHLWPKHGRVLDTTFDGYWYFLTEQQKKHQIQTFSWWGKHRSKTAEEKEQLLQKTLEQWRNTKASGFAKTHELGIFFNQRGHWSIGNLNCYDYVNKEIFCHADLEWQTKTKALDWVVHHPKDLNNFKEEEYHLSNMLKIVKENRKFMHMYGWLDWGGYYGQQLPLYPENFRYGDSTFNNTHYMPKWHRCKPKSHYFWGSFPWQMYFRTGERKWLSYAKTYTLYAFDRAFNHSNDPATRRRIGEEYHYNYSHMHWVGGSEFPGSMKFAGVMDRHDAAYNYWLTGDRRPLDTLFAWAKQTLKYFYKKRGQFQIMIKDGPYGNTGRNLGQLLNKLTLIYEITQEEKYLKAAAKVAESFKGIDVAKAEAGSREKVDNTNFHMRSAWIYEGLYRYYCVTGDKDIKDTLINYCQRASDRGTGFTSGGIESGSLNSFAYGYLLTNDLLYLDLGRRIIDREIFSGVSRAAFQAGSRKFRNTSMPRFLGVMANADQKWKDQNLPTHERGHSIDLRTYHSSWGGKTRNVYFQEEQDRSFSIHFASLRTGIFAIFNPEGKIVAKTKPGDLYMHRYKIKVKKDGMTGTYTLRQIKFDHDLPKSHLGYINIISSDLKKIVYDGFVKPIENQSIPFNARKWFVGVPANTKNAKVCWIPSRMEAFGQRHFKISSIDKSYESNTKNMDADYENDYGFFTFHFPKKEQLEVYECSPVYEDNKILKYIMPSYVGSQFRIFNAPPYVASSRESYFIPKIPQTYQKP